MVQDLVWINEATLRFSTFLSVFIIMAILERSLPRRQLIMPRRVRWTTNLAIVALDSLLVRAMAVAPFITGSMILPLVAIAMAVQAADWGWGMFNLVQLPAWIEIILALIILDFAIWFQHWASHKVPLFWRLHRMHHADRDIDVTTALRFHPIEIALSMLYKILWVLLLGPAAVAVLIFEIVLNGCAMFNHANVRLPDTLDRILRTVIVTPDMHRVHHSTDAREHHQNFGFNLSIWDRAFSTYVAQPAAGHEKMTIGLPDFLTPGPERLAWSLMIPFRGGRTCLGSRMS